MTDSNIIKIGIFDSGLGGLTVFKSLSSAYRDNTSFIYLGDLAHLPYGDNNSRTVTSALIEELSMFSITESGKFEGVGAHDDLVMA